MDESVRSFQEEQERISEAGGVGPWFRRQLSRKFVGLALVFSVMLALMGAMGTLPRNSDNSVQLAYLGPAFAVLGIGSLTALRRFRSMPLYIKPTLWALTAMSVVMVPIALVDTMSRNGS